MMKSLRRIIRKSIIFFFIIIAAFLYLSVPFSGGLYYSQHINGDVKIYREDNGIPHIHGKSLKDAYYGLGFVHAQDRLWQLHLRKMSSQGRLAEVFGNVEDIINIDKYIRNLGYMESARRIVEKYDPFVKEQLQAYANGINDGYKSLLVLPIEFQIVGVDFEEWEIFDSVCFTKLMALLNVSDQFQEFMRSKFDQVYSREMAKVLGAIGPDNQFQPENTVLNIEELKKHTKMFSNSTIDQFKESNGKISGIDIETIAKSMPEYYSQYLFPTFKGSNAWIIDGKHTKSGKPHLANDPHLDNGIPSQWYQAEILFNTYDGNNFIIGGTLPGLPMTLSGRSKYFGWGLTTLYSDGGDIFEETIEFRENKGYYLYNKEWYPVRYSKELLKVKGSTSISIELMHTHRGPIMEYYLQSGKLRNNEGKYYSLQSTIHVDDVDAVLSLIKFQTGNKFLEGLEGMKKVSYPNSGMVFISHDNHIAYLSSGRLVIRNGNPDDNGFVKAGNVGDKDWIGYVNLDEQPLVIDPEKGYIVCGNNKFMRDQNKYFLSWNTQPTARGKELSQQIGDKIKNGHKFTIQDHIDLHNDVQDSYVLETLPTLIKLINDNKNKDGINRDIIINHALRILELWDSKLEINSNGAALYSIFEYFYGQTFHSELDKWTKQQWYNSYVFDSFHFKNLIDMNQSKQGDPILNAKYCNSNSKQNNCLMNLVLSLEKAYLYLQEQFGKDSTQWKWGDIHNQHFPHAFSSTPFGFFFERRIPYKGNQRTPHVSQYSLDGKFDGHTGSNYKMIISLDPDEPNYYIVDTGSSGNPLSSHYDDQMHIWKRGEYIQMKFGERIDYPYLLQISPI